MTVIETSPAPKRRRRVVGRRTVAAANAARLARHAAVRASRREPVREAVLALIARGTYPGGPQLATLTGICKPQCRAIRDDLERAGAIPPASEWPAAPGTTPREVAPRTRRTPMPKPKPARPAAVPTHRGLIGHDEAEQRRIEGRVRAMRAIKDRDRSRIAPPESEDGLRRLWTERTPRIYRVASFADSPREAAP